MIVRDHGQSDPGVEFAEVWRGLVEEEVTPADELELPDPSGWPGRPIDKVGPDSTGATPN